MRLQNLTTDLSLARREIEVYKTTLSTMEGDKAALQRAVKEAGHRLDEAERKAEREEANVRNNTLLHPHRSSPEFESRNSSGEGTGRCSGMETTMG